MVARIYYCFDVKLIASNSLQTPPILSLNVSNVPGGISYSCVYTVGGEILSDTSDATIDSTNETVTCALPRSSKLPHFNGEGE